MTATLTTHRTIGLPSYKCVIRKGPVVLWSKTFRGDEMTKVIAFAETKREYNRLSCAVQS